MTDCKSGSNYFGAQIGSSSQAGARIFLDRIATLACVAVHLGPKEAACLAPFMDYLSLKLVNSKYKNYEGKNKKK